jgi:hypothetical protein
MLCVGCDPYFELKLKKISDKFFRPTSAGSYRWIIGREILYTTLVSILFS